MLKRYINIWLLLSGIFGIILGITLKIAWEESKFILAEWDDDPVVVVCPDSDVTPYRVHKAVEWWGIRGYEAAYIHFDKENKICSNGKWTAGIIFIRAEGELL